MVKYGLVIIGTTQYTSIPSTTQNNFNRSVVASIISTARLNGIHIISRFKGKKTSRDKSFHVYEFFRENILISRGISGESDCLTVN
jgi:hypothetical protein